MEDGGGQATDAAGSHGPIFVAGCGRSGTTYLKTIIDAHPDVFIPTESLFIADYLSFARALRRRTLEWLFFREPQLRSWYHGPRFPITDIVQAIRKVHEHAAAEEGARIWGQKTPRFVRYMDLFNRAFPDARWILLCRDPRGVVASMLESKRHTYSVRAACRRWLRDNQPIIDHLQSGHPGDSVMVIRYEDLVRRLDENVERVFRFLRLSPMTTGQILRGASVREYKGSTFSVAANTVRSGLDPRPAALERWTRTLSGAQIREIETRCGREMSILGYEPLDEGAHLARRPLEGLRRIVAPAKDVLILLEYMQHWPYYPVHTGIRKLAMHWRPWPIGPIGRRGGARTSVA